MKVRDAHDRVAGFTLIELVVAMVLMGAVGLLITRTLMGGLETSQKSISTQQALQRANAAIDLMASDIRSARAPDRDLLRTSSDVRDALAYPASVPSQSGPLDVRDLVHAEPNELWMRTDAVRELSGVQRAECVGWVVRAGSLWREVRTDGPTCRTSGQILRSKQVLTGLPTNAAPMFSYTRLNNPEVARFAGTTQQIDPKKCVKLAPVNSLPATSVALAEVVSVQIDLTSVVRRADQSGETGLRDAVSIRSRLNQSYLFGLGCSF